MRMQLQHVTRLGTPYQRSEPNGVVFVPSIYSRSDLESAAITAMREAVKYVFEVFHTVPVMGLTQHYQQVFSPPSDARRNFATGAYDEHGGICEDIPDCTCAHCIFIKSAKRFHDKAPDGPDLPPI